MQLKKLSFLICEFWLQIRTFFSKTVPFVPLLVAHITFVLCVWDQNPDSKFSVPSLYRGSSFVVFCSFYGNFVSFFPPLLPHIVFCILIGCWSCQSISSILCLLYRRLSTFPIYINLSLWSVVYKVCSEGLRTCFSTLWISPITGYFQNKPLGKNTGTKYLIFLVKLIHLHWTWLVHRICLSFVLTVKWTGPSKCNGTQRKRLTSDSFKMKPNQLPFLGSQMTVVLFLGQPLWPITSELV